MLANSKNYQHILEVIAGYTEWVEERLTDGKSKVYLITFQFNHLGRSTKATLVSMQREIERFYSVLLTRIVRRPKRKSQQRNLPILIAVPDSPVDKHQAIATVADISANLGLHFHALLLMPRKSRLKTGLRKHIRTNRACYFGNSGLLRQIHARRVRHVEGRVVDYVFKHVKRQTYSLDDVLIMPRSRSELLAA